MTNIEKELDSFLESLIQQTTIRYESTYPTLTDDESINHP